MPNLTIKNLPHDLYESLKQTAALHRRSINSEIIVVLERALRSERVAPERYLTRLEALSARLDLPTVNERDLKEAKESRRP